MNSFRFVAIALAAFLMVTGLQSGASAATTRTLTISASPAVGVAGTAVTFSGKISKSPKGTTVVIERKSGSKWVKAGSTRTVNSAGNYAVKLVRPKTVANYYYRATSAKKGSLRAAVSRTIAVAALKRTLASLSASASLTTAGTSVTLSGTVLPAVKGTAVTLQKKVGSSWTTVTTTSVLSNGTFSKGVIPTTTTIYRALIARTTLNAPATSNERTVQAKPLITTSTLTAATRLGSYTATLTTFGNQAGTWSAAPLPAGLSLNATTGVISGTPTSVGDTNVVIGFKQASTGLNAATKTITLRVNQAVAPTITTTTLPGGTVGVGYSTTLTAQGNPTGTWTASPLPDGLTLAAATGVISGTPTTVQTKQVVIGFTQTNTGLAAPSKTIALQISQAAAPVITTTSLPEGSVGDAYTATLTAQGSPAGTWTASPLPNGLSLNAATGVISGTPTASGDTNVVIGFTQTSTGVSATPKTLTLRVDPGANPVIATASLPNGTRLSPYTTTLTAVGNPAGTWTASPLPDGLSLSASTGVISGTPTTVQSVQVVIGFTQTSNGLAAAPKTLTLQIVQAAAPVITTASLPDGDRFQAYTTTLTAAGNPAGTWSASPLPDGLVLTPSTGVISGTPSTPGDTEVVVGFTQTSTGVAATPKTLTLHVNQAPAPVISTTNLPDGTRLSAYSTTLTATGNPAGTWTASPLPAGLSLNPNTGAITGTPTAVGDTSVVIGFTQASTGLAATPKTLTLHVNEASPPVISTVALPDALRYHAYTTTLTVAGNPAGTWTASPIPAGMSFNTTTGVLSGAPRNAGDTNITFTFTQTNTGLSSGNKVLTLHVVQSNPVILTTSLPPAGVLTFYSQTLQVAPAPVGKWSFVGAGGGFPLASGMSLNVNTGEISGTPLYGFSKDLVIRFTETSTNLSSVVTIPFQAS